MTCNYRVYVRHQTNFDKKTIVNKLTSSEVCNLLYSQNEIIHVHVTQEKCQPKQTKTITVYTQTIPVTACTSTSIIPRAQSL